MRRFCFQLSIMTTCFFYLPPIFAGGNRVSEEFEWGYFTPAENIQSILGDIDLPAKETVHPSNYTDWRLPQNLELRDLPAPFNKGVFVRNDVPAIPKGTILGIYAGEYKLVNLEESNDLSYAVNISELLELDEDEHRRFFGDSIYNVKNDYRLIVDALKKGNWCRYINHGGFRFNVTMELKNIPWPKAKSKKYAPVVFVIAKDNILAGHQLLFDYGKDYWNQLRVTPQELHSSTFLKQEERSRRSLEAVNSHTPGPQKLIENNSIKNKALRMHRSLGTSGKFSGFKKL